MKSKFLGLNSKDAIKALIMTMLAVLVSTLIVSLNEGTFPMTWVLWKPIVISTVSAGLTYILKNWLTNSEGQPFKKEVNKDNL